MKKIIINENDAGQRLDKFILKTFKSLPKDFLYKSLRKKDIKLNSKRISKGDIFLNFGDILEIYIKDELLKTDKNFTPVDTTDFENQIIYEDNNIILIDKPPAVSVHGDGKDADGYVIHLKSYLYNKGEYDYLNEQSFSPAFCNRLDKNTGGILNAGKNSETLREMSEIIKLKVLSKKYLCIVEGKTDFNGEIISAYHKKDSKNKKALISNTLKNEYKKIETGFTTIENRENSSVLEVNLLTGRFHQIRAHLAFLGHPIKGDVKYGAKKEKEFPFQALYAYKLIFNCKNYPLLGYLHGKEFKSENIWFF